MTLRHRRKARPRETPVLGPCRGTDARDRQTANDAHKQTASVHVAAGNQLLARLPASVLARLTPHLELVQLERQDVVFRSHERVTVVYFPLTAAVSFVTRVESGQMLEVAIVGRDGMTATAVFPGTTTMACDGIVQIAGAALRIDADVLRREVAADAPLHLTVGRYVQQLLGRSMQLSACNVFHSAEQRCVRWLLTVSDLIGRDEIPLTHEALATMLGLHRPTVTQILGSLDRAGLVDEERGRVVLRDRHRLGVVCCECYAVMRDEQRRLLGD